MCMSLLRMRPPHGTKNTENDLFIPITMTNTMISSNQSHHDMRMQHHIAIRKKNHSIRRRPARTNRITCPICRTQVTFCFTTISPPVTPRTKTLSLSQHWVLIGWLITKWPPVVHKVETKVNVDCVEIMYLSRWRIKCECRDSSGRFCRLEPDPLDTTDAQRLPPRGRRHAQRRLDAKTQQAQEEDAPDDDHHDHAQTSCDFHDEHPIRAAINDHDHK